MLGSGAWACEKNKPDFHVAAHERKLCCWSSEPQMQSVLLALLADLLVSVHKIFWLDKLCYETAGMLHCETAGMLHCETAGMPHRETAEMPH